MLPDVGEAVRGAKVLVVAAAFALLGVGILVGVLIAKWVG